MELQNVDSSTIPVWRWQASSFATVLLIPITGFALNRATPEAMFGLALYVFAAACCCWFLPAAHYRRLRFGVDQHGITIERGIWWRSRIALPRIRVQHSDVSQGPLQRRYGVATLKLYTAGSRFTKIELSGLLHDDALGLRDALIARGGDSGV